jgi:hypothetical protein
MLWRHDRQSELTIALCASPSAGGTVSGGGTFASGSSRTVAVDRQQRLHVCHLDRERHCGQLIGNLHAHPQRQSRPGGQFRRQSTAPTVKANARSQQAYQLDRAGAGLVGDSPCPGPRSEMAARSLGEFLLRYFSDENHSNPGTDSLSFRHHGGKLARKRVSMFRWGSPCLLDLESTAWVSGAPTDR